MFYKLAIIFLLSLSLDASGQQEDMLLMNGHRRNGNHRYVVVKGDTATYEVWFTSKPEIIIASIDKMIKGQDSGYYSQASSLKMTAKGYVLQTTEHSWRKDKQKTYKLAIATPDDIAQWHGHHNHTKCVHLRRQHNRYKPAPAGMNEQEYRQQAADAFNALWSRCYKLTEEEFDTALAKYKEQYLVQD